MSTISTIAGVFTILFETTKESASSGATVTTETALKMAPTKEAYFQVLAQDAVYRTWANGQALTPSEHFPNPGYRVEKTIQYPEGIRAISVISEQAKEAPLLIFQGTDLKNLDNLMDDLNKNIAELNCKKYKKELKGELKRLASTYGRVHLLGHSYGGTVAQRLTAKHPEFISRCSHYNSPAAGKKAAKKFQKSITKLAKNIAQPEIWSYRHAKDITSLLGGDLLPVTTGRNYTVGSISDAISYIGAHSALSLSTRGSALMANVSPDAQLKNIASFLEKARRGVGKATPLFKKISQLF